MKYSGSGRDMSWYVRPCWSAKTELSRDSRNAVKPLNFMIASSTDGTKVLKAVAAVPGGDSVGGRDGCGAGSLERDMDCIARSSEVCGGDPGALPLGQKA